MNWLQDVTALLQLAPLIIALIKQVEQLFGAGDGATKKAAVMGALIDAPPHMQISASNFVDKVAPAIGAKISGVHTTPAVNQTPGAVKA